MATVATWRESDFSTPTPGFDSYRANVPDIETKIVETRHKLTVSASFCQRFLFNTLTGALAGRTIPAAQWAT